MGGWEKKLGCWMQFPLIPTAVVRAPRAWGVYKPKQRGSWLLQKRWVWGGRSFFWHPGLLGKKSFEWFLLNMGMAAILNFKSLVGWLFWA